MKLKSFVGALPKPVLQGLIALGFLGAVILTRDASHAFAEVRITGIIPRDRVFQGEVFYGMTVLDALNAAVVAGEIPLEFHIDPDRDSAIVTRIDGHDRVQEANITFFMNDKLIRSDKIHQTPIRPRDRILVKLLQ
jgi:hypothetical protein